jgi:hypothetical protein
LPPSGAAFSGLLFRFLLKLPAGFLYTAAFLLSPPFSQPLPNKALINVLATSGPSGLQLTEEFLFIFFCCDYIIHRPLGFVNRFFKNF